MVAQVEIERQIVVWRDQIGRVVGFSRVDVISAGRLQADDGIAELMDREFETLCRLWREYFGKSEEGVVFGLAPAGCNIVFDILRQGIKILFVERERQGGATVCVGAIGQPVCGAGHHLIHECLGIGGR